ncbi:hypothetical protein BST94_11285 [Nonlabens xylanidelens]|nr:hypothetical protein BST94_11285 [Nonlabens xylanidelens]
MKLFFSYISKVLIILVVLNYGLEPILDHGLNSLEGSVYNEWNKIVNGNVNADIIVMGSSRGVVGYNSAIIEDTLGFSCFNLSFDAGPHNLQYAKLNSYLKENKMPQIIIQNIDIAHFSKINVIPFEKQLITTINSSHIQNVYDEIPGTLQKFKYKGVSKFSVDTRLIKLSLSNLIGLDPQYSSKIKGYKGIEKSFELDKSNLLRLESLNLENKLEGIHHTFDFYNQKCFENTIIYFVWAPELNVRRDLKRDVINDCVAIIEKKTLINSNMHFIDLRDDIIGDDSKYFYDSFHLNASGSEWFSRKLVSLIKQD